MARGKVVALVSQKGGAGKTTVTMQLAAGLQRVGRKVRVIDLDPQQSALRWAEAGQGPDGRRRFDACAADGEALPELLARIRHEAEFILLDCPPSVEQPATAEALRLAHLAVVPVVPSPTDLWSSRAVERLILNIGNQNPRLKAALLPNRVARTALAGEVLELLHEFTLPVVAAALAQRNAYAQSAVLGASVFELGRAAAAAQDEVRRLVAAILELLGEKQ
jgi:chromosome partitioning protein